MTDNDKTSEEIADETVFPPREVDVLRRWNDGSSAPELAEELEISPGAVRQAIASARNRVEQIEKSLEFLEKTSLRPILPIEYTPDVPVTDSDWGGASWTQWKSLKELRGEFNNTPGVIRLRHWAVPGLVYIGYSSRVNGRLNAIHRKVSADEQPDTAPVSAAPELWELVQQEGPGIEGSVLLLPEAPQTRLAAVQVALLSMHRQQVEQSPITAFGGANRGTDEELESYPPLDWASYEDHDSDNWLGLNWSSWRPLSERLSEPKPKDKIVYEIRSPAGTVVKVGATTVPGDRLRTHERRYEEDAAYEFRFVELDVGGRELDEIEAEVHGAVILLGLIPLDFQRF